MTDGIMVGHSEHTLHNKRWPRRELLQLIDNNAPRTEIIETLREYLKGQTFDDSQIDKLLLLIEFGEDIYNSSDDLDPFQIDP